MRITRLDVATVQIKVDFLFVASLLVVAIMGA